MPTFLTGDLVIYTEPKPRGFMPGRGELPPRRLLATVIAVHMIHVEAGRKSASSRFLSHLETRGKRRVHAVGPYLDIMFNSPVDGEILAIANRTPHETRGRHPMDSGPTVSEKDRWVSPRTSTISPTRSTMLRGTSHICELVWSGGQRPGAADRSSGEG